MAPPADDDNDKLLAIAASISEGMPIDWQALRQRCADAGEAALVGELELLQTIAASRGESASWGSLSILDVIGRGAFATVYRGFDAELHRDVAVKITGLHDAAPFETERAVREARMLARVRHPNVVTVFSAQRKENAVAVVMDLIKGETLDELVRRQGPLSAQETTLIGLDLCRAVAAVHEAGLLHGDIKAHNVMREEGGRIVLMDFGAGKDLRGAVHAGGDVAGTPVYLAPEVFAGQSRTQSADIYSLGVLLYHLVSGDYPVPGDTASQVDRHHAEGAPRRRLRDLRADLPDTFVRVVEQAIAVDPRERYRTVGELATALAATFVPRLEAAAERRRWQPIAAGAAVLTVAAIAAGIVFSRPRESSGEGNVAAAATVGSAAAIADRYRVEAAMFRVGNDGAQRLRRTEPLSPGDQLYLQVQTSIPAYAYVVNEDDNGKAVLLFPLPGEGNHPLPAARASRLPGLQNGVEVYWQVTTPGQREHFIIFVSPVRLTDIEQLVATLPPPRVDEPIRHAELPAALMRQLRSVGGLVAAPSQPAGTRLSAQYTTPLGDGPEDARGVWVRQIAFENPRP